MGKLFSRIPPQELRDLKEETYFEKEELKTWYKSFQRDYPSGLLSKEDFGRLYSKFYQNTNADKFANHVFRTFDVNQDGAIDFREFICSLSVTTRGSLEQKLQWAFSIYDVDGNGYISQKELIQIVSSIKRMVGAMNDQNQSQDKLMRIFTDFDENRDGRLSLNEFIDGAKRDPTFIKMLQLEE